MSQQSTTDQRWATLLRELTLERNAPLSPSPGAPPTQRGEYQPITADRAARNAAVLDRETAAWEKDHTGENRRHLRAAS